MEEKKQTFEELKPMLRPTGVETGVMQVDPEKCTACGNCVEACPRDLIELHPVSHRMFVFCKSHDKGPTVKKACSVGCIACRLCVKNCSVENGITVEKNLAVINHDICPASDVVVEKCPMNTIQMV